MLSPLNTALPPALAVKNRRVLTLSSSLQTGSLFNAVGRSCSAESKPLLHFGYAQRLQPGSKIMIVADAWKPSVEENPKTPNGVYNTISNINRVLQQRGYQVEIVHPYMFKTWHVPEKVYPDTDIARPWHLDSQLGSLMEKSRPDGVVTMVEGPLGWATWLYGRQNHMPFSSCYTTKWPEFAQQFAHIPQRLTYGVLRFFHGQAHALLVNTGSNMEELRTRGFDRADNLRQWTRGVDTTRFRIWTPQERNEFCQRTTLPAEYKKYHSEQSTYAELQRPFYLYAGRVSSEKNIEAFLKCDLPGTKIVVGPPGNGLDLKQLQAEYPDVVFTGAMSQEELAKFYGISDIFVFPSKTDTFGNVMLEALASGMPVVAYDFTGPKDVIDPRYRWNLTQAEFNINQVGYLACPSRPDRHKLGDVSDYKALEAMAKNAWKNLSGSQGGEAYRQACRNYAETFTWDNCVDILLENLKPCHWDQILESKAMRPPASQGTGKNARRYWDV